MRLFAGRRWHLTTLVRLACLALPFLFASLAQADEAAPQTVAVGDVLRGHFVQDRQLAGFARPLRSEGSFVLVPGTGLIWQGEKPFANTTVITSNGIVQLAGGQEAMRLPASKLPGLSRLYDVLGAALSGNIAPLRQTFDVTKTAEGDAWQIVLVPHGAAAAQLKSLKLAGKRFVDAVDIDHGGGDMDHIDFLDQNVAPANLTAEEKSLLHTLSK
jgi:hypothetical protein